MNEYILITLLIAIIWVLATTIFLYRQKIIIKIKGEEKPKSVKGEENSISEEKEEQKIFNITVVYNDDYTIDDITKVVINFDDLISGNYTIPEGFSPKSVEGKEDIPPVDNLDFTEEMQMQNDFETSEPNQEEPVSEDANTELNQEDLNEIDKIQNIEQDQKSLVDLDNQKEISKDANTENHQHQEEPVSEDINQEEINNDWEEENRTFEGVEILDQPEITFDTELEEDEITLDNNTEESSIEIDENRPF